jgi:hypothetical protein
VATYGWGGPAWNFYRFTGQNTDNNVSSGPVSFPQAGTVTAIVFYCAGRLGTITAQGCIWNASGGLIGAGSAISVGIGGQSVGGQGWQSSPCSIVLTQGQVICMGWWRNPALGSDCVWSEQQYGGAVEYLGTTAGSSSAGSFGHDTTYAAQVGVYVVYTPTTAPIIPPAPILSAPTLRGNARVYAEEEAGVLP